MAATGPSREAKETAWLRAGAAAPRRINVKSRSIKDTRRWISVSVTVLVISGVLALLAGCEKKAPASFERPPAPVTVVTADRALRDRVEAAGARTVTPSWLLDQL